MTTSLSLFMLVVFLAGLYFCIQYADPNHLEGLTNISVNRCPNFLIQKGARFYLYNSKLAKVPGVNPVEFENLEDYTEFLDWQKSQGIHCPVLFLQQSNNAQGEQVYNIRPSPTDLQGGMPTALPLIPRSFQGNAIPVPGFSTSGPSPYMLGEKPSLQVLDEAIQRSGLSPDPMDDNWGGADFTQSLVNKGYYAGNEVNIRVA